MKDNGKMICRMDLGHTIGFKEKETINRLRLSIKDNGNSVKDKDSELSIITMDVN